ncbi:MAG: 5-oxoprolinase subunit PxpA [Pseudomonadota bacterium]
MIKVDLNADMGESFGDWTLGQDAQLLNTVTSANIACGFHAGDPDVMAKTMALAVEKGVGIGCHPGFNDLQGFGRRKMHVPVPTLQNWVRYQLGASQAMAKAAGGTVRHFKLHGAWSNMAMADRDMARACYEAALQIDPDIVIMVLSGTVMEQAVRELGCNWAGEIFADRAYKDDATLVDRALPGAVIHDAERAAKRIAEMVTTGAIISESGARIEAQIDTICCHGDTPEAVEIAARVRRDLEAHDVTVTKL